MSSAQFCKPNAGKSYSKSTVFPMSGLQNWAQTRCIRYEHASGYLRQNLKTLNTYKRKKDTKSGNVLVKYIRENKWYKTQNSCCNN